MAAEIARCDAVVVRGPSRYVSRLRIGWIAIALAAPILLALAFWATRAPVTDVVVRRYFAAHGVTAQARTAQVGRHRLVFEDVRLGPAAAPEFAAHRVTIDLGWSRLSPSIQAVRLDGARLQMRVDARGADFGTLDRLIPPGRSTRFPAVRLEAPDAVVQVATPGGGLTWRLEGRGRLDHDFRATARLAPANLDDAGCRVSLPEALAVATTAATSFVVTASGVARTIICHGTAQQVAWTVSFRAPLSLGTLAGSMDVAASPVRFGTVRSGSSNVSATISGSPASVSGRWRFTSTDTGTDKDYAANVAAGGSLRWRRGGTVDLEGSGAARRISSATLATVWPSTDRWPVLAARLVERARAASRALSAQGRFTARIGHRAEIRVTSLDAVGETGARLHFAGGSLGWTASGFAIDGLVDGGGGGLPAARVIVAPTKAGYAGALTIGPWRDRTSALAMTSGRFALIGSRVTLAGDVALSSDFAGGRVDGLRFPVALAFKRAGGAIAVGNACTPVSVERIAFGPSTLAATRLTLCPVSAGPLLSVNRGRLVGDVDIAASDFRGDMSGKGFVFATRAMRLQLRGTTAAPTLSTPAAALTAAIDTWRGTATVAGI